MNTTPLLGSLLTAAAICFSPMSQAVDKAALLEKIRSQSSEFSEFKALLNSPEQNVRLAAFDTMYNSGDPVLKELALDEALAYPDATLQAVALKELVLNRDNLNFALSEPEGANDKTKSFLKKVGYKMSFRLNKVDRATGMITQCNVTGGCAGQITGLQVAIRYSNCHMEAILSEDQTLEGEYRCRGMQPLPASAILK